MFCDKCGYKMDDNAASCPNCGNEIIPKAKNKPGISKLKLTLIIILVIITLLIVIIFKSGMGSVGSIIFNLYNGNCDKATEIYNEDFEYGESNFILNMGLDNVIDNTLENLKDGKISLEEASDIIVTIENMGIDKVNEKIASVNNEMSDIITILEAEDALEKGDYILAMTKYSEISEDSAKYQDALEGLNNVKSSFAENSLQLIEDYISQGKIDEANDLILNVEEYGINDISDDLMTKYCESMNSYINTYLEDNNYSEAEKIVNDISKTFPDEEKIVELSENLKSNYEKIVLEKAQQEFQNMDYEKAASTMETALSQDEDNVTFKEKYNEYKSYLPAFLSEMDYLNINTYINDNYSDLSDNTGKAYKRIYSLGGWGGDYYAEYLINGNYTNFDGVVGVCYDERATDKSKFFEVYGDGILLYTSPVCKASTMPQSFSIDITGVKILKIYYPKSDGYSSIASIFDGKLYNTNYLNKPSENTTN